MGRNNNYLEHVPSYAFILFIFLHLSYICLAYSLINKRGNEQVN